MHPEISIIIPTFNRASLLRKALPGYLKQQGLLEVILVDDSTNPEDKRDLQALAAEDPRIVLIQNDKKEGMTRSRNIGVQKARGRFVFFGEDDLILPPDHLSILLIHQKAADADIIGGRVIWLLRENESVEQALARENRKKGNPFDTFLMNFHCYLPGTEDVPAPFIQSCALIKRDVFQKVRFDEEYAGFTKGYCWREETDFFISANEKGFRTFFCPHAVAFNLPTQPGGTHQWSHWQTEYWMLKNQWHLLRKHRAFIRNRLNNRYPVFLLWFAYCLSRMYGNARNLLWHTKQKLHVSIKIIPAGFDRIKNVFFHQRYPKAIQHINMSLARGAATSPLRQIDPCNPSSWEFQAFSQNGEDGIIDYLTRRIKDSNRYFVEIGSSDGIENNSAWLAIARRFSGIMVEGNKRKSVFSRALLNKLNLGVECIHMFAGTENIGNLTEIMLHKYPDVFSLDIDGNDYFIAREFIKAGVRPKIAIVEYNSTYGPSKSMTIKYRDGFDYHKAHRSQLYYGASIAAWKKFFTAHGYRFVTVDLNGVNAFFIDPAAFDESFVAGIRGLEYGENFYQMRKFQMPWERQFEMIKQLEFEAV